MGEKPSVRWELILLSQLSQANHVCSLITSHNSLRKSLIRHWMQFVRSLSQASVDHSVQSTTCSIQALNPVNRYHWLFLSSIMMNLQRLFTSMPMMIIQNLRHMSFADSSRYPVMETLCVLALRRSSVRSLMRLQRVHTSLFSLTAMVMQKIVQFHHCFLQQLFTTTLFARRLEQRSVLLLKQAMFAKCIMSLSLSVMEQLQ